MPKKIIEEIKAAEAAALEIRKKADVDARAAVEIAINAAEETVNDATDSAEESTKTESLLTKTPLL